MFGFLFFSCVLSDCTPGVILCECAVAAIGGLVMTSTITLSAATLPACEAVTRTDKGAAETKGAHQAETPPSVVTDESEDSPEDGVRIRVKGSAKGRSSGPEWSFGDVPGAGAMATDCARCE